MRKLTAILLIALLAFNWYGYRLLINYMEQEATSHLQAKLDNHQYDESSLIEMRVPLNMPYVADWKDFESYEGETQIDGVHYKYVKRKIEKGELVLLCIPNQQKTSLQAAKHDLFKQVNDIDQQDARNDSKEHSAKSSTSDYITHSFASVNKIHDNASTAYQLYSYFIPVTFASTPSQPPEC